MRTALSPALLALCLATVSCSSDGSKDPASASPPATASAGATTDETNAAEYDRSWDIGTFKVAPKVSKDFTKADIASAEKFVTRWITELVTRPEDIFRTHSKKSFQPADFEYLHPYIAESTYQDLLDFLPGAFRADRAEILDRPGRDEKVADEDNADRSNVFLLNASSANTSDFLDEKLGLIDPKADNLTITDWEGVTNGIEVGFRTSTTLAYADPEKASKTGYPGTDDGADAVRLVLQRSLTLYRPDSGANWVVYGWQGSMTETDGVMLADAPKD